MNRFSRLAALVFVMMVEVGCAPAVQVHPSIAARDPLLQKWQ